jgi:hypothetical protein
MAAKARTTQNLARSWNTRAKGCLCVLTRLENLLQPLIRCFPIERLNEISEGQSVARPGVDENRAPGRILSGQNNIQIKTTILLSNDTQISFIGGRFQIIESLSDIAHRLDYKDIADCCKSPIGTTEEVANGN